MPVDSPYSPKPTGTPSAPEWLTVALAGLAAVNCRAPILCIGPLLPLIVAELNVNATTAGALTALPLLLMGMLSIPAGVVGDRIGPRRVLAITQTTIVLAGAARALSADVPQLLLATAVLGAGIGLAQPAFAQVAGEARRLGVGLATAVYSNGFTLGALGAIGLTAPVLLPLFGGSWRASVLFWAAAGLVAMIGWLALAVRAPPHPSVSGPVLGQLGAVLALPGLRPVVWLFTSQSIIFYALAAWMPTLYVSHGWAVEAATLPLLAFQIASVMGSLGAPVFASRLVGFSNALLIASAASTIGLVGFIALPLAAPFLWASLVGVGVCVVFVLILTGPALIAPPTRVGATAGVMMATGYLGSMSGSFLLGALRDLTASFLPGFVLLILISASMAIAARSLPASLAKR